MSETTETQQETQAEAQTAPETAPSAPDLNISDLVALRNIIDISTSRGAFRAGEMEAIGKTYNKLSAFLEAVGNAKKE